MKIAIDTQTTLGQKSGFGFYVKNLVEALKKDKSGDNYILISPDDHQDFSTPQRFIWDQFRFPKAAKKEKVDILHQPCFSAPVFYRGNVVVTCHDIISMKFPKNLPFFSRMFYSKWMPYSYKVAKMIIADSENTKKDMVEYLEIPEEKIRVVHLAVSEEFQPKNKLEIEKAKKKYGIKGKYFIDVGTIEPRKNLPFLARAFAIAVKSGISERLVITGKKGWYYDNLFKLVEELKLGDKVVFTGYADDKDIPALYSGATALVFPSLYEGFGFTPLEAMACGTPVISSNTSSLPEVVGDSGILLPPKDEKSWARKIVEVSENTSLREDLKLRGLKQAKKFTWEKVAKETIKVYREALDAD